MSPTQQARLEDRKRLLTLELTTLVIVVVSFVAIIALQFRSSYVQASRGVDQTRAACERGLLERIENIDSDIRQGKFFAAAAKARRASGTKLDIKTADGYDLQSRQAYDASARRAERMLGTDLEIMRLRDGRWPAPQAMAEAQEACERVNPKASWFDV